MTTVRLYDYHKLEGVLHQAAVECKRIALTGSIATDAQILATLDDEGKEVYGVWRALDPVVTMALTARILDRLDIVTNQLDMVERQVRGLN